MSDIEFFPAPHLEDSLEAVTFPLARREFRIEEAPPKVRAMALKFAEAEWPHVKVYYSCAWTTDEFFAGETEAHAAGDLKKAAHETQHWWLNAAFPTLKLVAQVEWQEGVTPAGRQSIKYISALCHDPLGIPTELFVDYSPSAQSLRILKGEPEEVHKQRVAATLSHTRYLDSYNDGASYLNHTPVFTKAGEFDTWTQEALDMSARYLERNQSD